MVVAVVNVVAVGITLQGERIVVRSVAAAAKRGVIGRVVSMVVVVMPAPAAVVPLHQGAIRCVV